MRKMAMLTRSLPHSFDGTKWHYKKETLEVEIMTTSGRFAMVRQVIDNRGCMPFVCLITQLEPQK